MYEELADILLFKLWRSRWRALGCALSLYPGETEYFGLQGKNVNIPGVRVH